MINANSLKELLKNHEVIPVKFAGKQLLLDASGALVWPQKNMLIFSDLHLEKGSYLSQFANPLPRFDSSETLSRMSRTIKRYACENVICLGDSLHDRNAVDRMQPDDLQCINKLVKTVINWTWVLGNHDPQIPQAILGERAVYVCVENLLFVHEPEDLAQHQQCQAQVIGHYHQSLAIDFSIRLLQVKALCVPRIFY